MHVLFLSTYSRVSIVPFNFFPIPINLQWLNVSHQFVLVSTNKRKIMTKYHHHHYIATMCSTILYFAYKTCHCYFVLTNEFHSFKNSIRSINISTAQSNEVNHVAIIIQKKCASKPLLHIQAQCLLNGLVHIENVGQIILVRYIFCVTFKR